MATKTAARRTPQRQSRSRATGRGNSSRGRSRGVPEPTRRERARAAASRELSGHASDAAAVALVVLSALTTLGLTSSLAGPVGSGLADVFGALVGQARYAIPAVGLGFAVLLFVNRPSARLAMAAEAEEDESHAEPALLRVGLGVVLLVIVIVGVLQLVHHNPSIDSSFEVLRDAGGVIGAALVGTLTSAAGEVGAAVVLAGIGIVGRSSFPDSPCETSSLDSGAGCAGSAAGRVRSPSCRPVTPTPVRTLTTSSPNRLDGEPRSTTMNRHPRSGSRNRSSSRDRRPRRQCSTTSWPTFPASARPTRTTRWPRSRRSSFRRRLSSPTVRPR